MKEKTGSRIGSYGVAVICAAAGIAFPLVTKPFVGQSAPWVSFVPAVLISALYGGFTPGLVTTGLLVAATFAMEKTLFTEGVSSGTIAFAGFMFVVAALAICHVIRAMREAQAAALKAAAAAQQAEARAEAQRDRLDVIVRDLPVGVVIATKDGKVELANSAAMEIHGAPLKAGDELPFYRGASVLHAASGEEMIPGHWPIRRSLRSNEHVVNEEIDIRRPDGSSKSLIVNARPLESATAIATYSDVTSLRAAEKALRGCEERLRRLFDSNIIGVVSGDTGIAREANDGFLEMLGFTRQDLKAGKILFPRLTPPGFEEQDARARAQLVERGFCDAYQKELLAVDGHSVPVMVGAISTETGQSSPWTAWVLDLSEHRKLEERLRQAAKAESIGLLAGGVAHDFNNLLTIIIGNASMASASLPEDSAGHAQLDNALRAAERAADLTRQLLAYAGKGRFVVRHIDVSASIREIGTLFRASAPRNVEIQLDLVEGLPMVNADATQIQQLVMNLVINGVESHGEGAGYVRVSTSARKVNDEFLRSAHLVEDLAPGQYVLIQVTDSGCGMDADTRLRIFDPFFTTKFTGRGLGLAAVAGIIRAHQGGMIVQSLPDQGSTFQVFLPVAVPLEGRSENINIVEKEPVTAG